MANTSFNIRLIDTILGIIIILLTTIIIWAGRSLVTLNEEMAILKVNTTGKSIEEIRTDIKYIKENYDGRIDQINRTIGNIKIELARNIPKIQYTEMELRKDYSAKSLKRYISADSNLKNSGIDSSH